MKNSNQINFYDPFKISEVEIYPENLAGLKMLTPPVKPKRFLFHGDRFYYYQDEEGNISPEFKSVTTATDHGNRSQGGIMKWYAANGWEGAKKILAHSSLYGTFEHICKSVFSAKVLESGSYGVQFSVRDLKNVFEDYRGNLDLPLEWSYQYFDTLCRSMAAWRRFFILYEVRPLLIEKTLLRYMGEDDFRNVAGTLDLAFTYTKADRYASGENKHKPKAARPKFEPVKDVLAILDNKSRTNKNGAYETGILQLELLAQLFETNFGKRPDSVFHYNPTDWRSRPDFLLEEIPADHPENKNVDPVLQVAHNRITEKGPIYERNYKTTIEGYFGEDPESGFNFNTLTVKEALETYESGGAATIGLGPDAEDQAEKIAGDKIRETFVSSKEV